ncbi:DUF2953 domain-containing protein [Peribacillus glennii]|uniref:DUF2953 domain-containing protein n=1 Tax=Peribacillus glennii TaxID=2303991 RepID=A0A372LIM2_9BACI|nr:DUF2953 domain-containing protein [Peribacillus glennii]RFU66222.1 DUF2953 domain-containing protein [Peribacillus glennii]
MAWAFGITAFFLALLVLLVFTRVKIIVHYHHQPPTPDDFCIKLRAWFGILRYTMNVPMNKKTHNASKDQDMASKESEKENAEGPGNSNLREYPLNGLMDTDQFISKFYSYHRLCKAMFRKVKVRKFEWHSLAGTGDAFYTGMVAGGFLAVKGSIIGILDSYLHFKRQPAFSVTPDFARPVFYTSITCIFQVRIGEAILAAIKLSRYLNAENTSANTNVYNGSEEQPM